MLAKNYLSESRDKYRWPEPSERDIGKPGNDMTMSCNMNYDLNIDFKRNKLEDFKPLVKPTEVNLNKNIFVYFLELFYFHFHKVLLFFY